MASIAEPVKLVSSLRENGGFSVVLVVLTDKEADVLSCDHNAPSHLWYIPTWTSHGIGGAKHPMTRIPPPPIGLMLETRHAALSRGER
jgi:hypothetical protein